MSNIKLLDSLHTKILYSKLAETITEQEIDALIDCKEQIKETYNQALEDVIKIYNEMQPQLATHVYEFGERIKALKK